MIQVKDKAGIMETVETHLIQCTAFPGSKQISVNERQKYYKDKCQAHKCVYAESRSFFFSLLDSTFCVKLKFPEKG